jgi:hypothetical protein
MIYLAIPCVALMALVFWDRRQSAIRFSKSTDAFNAEREAWTVERAELITRIQHPRVVSIPTHPREREPPAEDADLLRNETDESELVGTIVSNDPTLNGDV